MIDEAEIERLQGIEKGVKDLLTLKELAAQAAETMAEGAGPMDAAILKVLARQSRELVGVLSDILTRSPESAKGQLVEIDRDAVYVWHGLEPLKWGDRVVLPGVPEDWVGEVTGYSYGTFEEVVAVLRRA